MHLNMKFVIARIVEQVRLLKKINSQIFQIYTSFTLNNSYLYKIYSKEYNIKNNLKKTPKLITLSGCQDTLNILSR